MKKFFTLIAVCAVALAANAQIVSSSSRRITTEQMEFPNYNRLFISYAPTTFSNIDDGDESFTLSGFAIGWLGGWSVSKTAPLYVEGGLNLKYNKDNTSDSYEDGYVREYEKCTYTLLSLNVPINISYKWSISNIEGLSVAPYVGFHLTGNIIGKEKLEYQYEDRYNSNEWNEEINLFDKDDMEEDDTANRFQLGWQAGVGVNYKALYVGVGYSGEFTKYWDTVNTGGITLTLGYNF